MHDNALHTVQRSEQVVLDTRIIDYLLWSASGAMMDQKGYTTHETKRYLKLSTINAGR